VEKRWERWKRWKGEGKCCVQKIEVCLSDQRNVQYSRFHFDMFHLTFHTVTYPSFGVTKAS
jgi:hypothetical protein